MSVPKRNMEAERIHLFVCGIVQGVGFRYAARHQALSLGLSGWVRNTEDGRVEIEAWGPRDRIDQLVAWCHEGPPSAEVERVEIRSRVGGDAQATVGFEIRR